MTSYRLTIVLAWALVLAGAVTSCSLFKDNKKPKHENDGTCADRIDNDDDGSVDCADPDCQDALLCQDCSGSAIKVSCGTSRTFEVGNLSFMDYYPDCQVWEEFPGTEMVFVFTTPEDMRVDIHVGPPDQFSALVVLQEECRPAWNCVDINEKFTGDFSFDAEGGVPYYIVLERKDPPPEGSFWAHAQIECTSPPQPSLLPDG